MLAVCIDCWQELQSEDKRCPRCGAIINSESHSYERLLFWALKNSQPDHRAEVCKVLGLRGGREALAHLLEAVNDHATVVRIAALGALGAIGGESARLAIERVLESASLEVRSAARRALEKIDTFSIPSKEDSASGSAHKE